MRLALERRRVARAALGLDVRLQVRRAPRAAARAPDGGLQRRVLLAQTRVLLRQRGVLGVGRFLHHWSQCWWAGFAFFSALPPGRTV